MKLSVLIPVFNEADSVEEVVRRVAAVELDLEIIVVDDASTDSTPERLRNIADDRVLLLSHPDNRGKGAAVRTALDAASGDAVVIQDADLEYFPEDFPRLFAPGQEGKADAVYGVRDLSSQPLTRRFGNRFLTWFTNALFGSQLSDMETCYKLIRTPMARSLRLQADQFDIEPEITVRLLQAGATIREVPVRYAPRRARKLNPWTDGPHALYTLLRLRRTGPPRMSETNRPTSQV